ncbi:MAG: polyprenyl synthetase family protein [Acidobacteriota bacterium]
MLSDVAKTIEMPEVMGRLRDLCEERGLGELARNLEDLGRWIADDLVNVERELQEIEPHPTSLVEKAGTHLLGVGGKRLRPLCVVLASRVGSGASRSVLDLAIAVELVHNATLLHDDVIDVADQRRGRSAARVEFGNAASIYAGDWLLVEALRRVDAAGVPGAMSSLLETIAQMIDAESLQLENRGRIHTNRDLYFEIAEGKSATLFQWAMLAGALAGGLGVAEAAALQEYGRKLGIAFQVIDDLIDVAGDPAETGKALFTDLGEGKMTFPLIVALEREPSLGAALEAAAQGHGDPQEIVAAVQRTGAANYSRELAEELVEQAVVALEALPQSPTRSALTMLARSTIYRSH